MGDNQKRRSLLFSFGKSTPKETGKFEVVNRKKNPASHLAPATAARSQPRSPSPSPFDTQSTTAYVSRPVVSSSSSQATKSPASSSHKPSTASSLPSFASPKSQNHHIAFHPLRATKSPSLSPEEILQSDLPASNLNVNFNVPPVPDYNSTLYTPPVTIKGRSVSLAKKGPPPRRKPPPLAELSSEPKNNSTSALSVESQGTGAFSFQSTELKAQVSNDVKSTDSSGDALPVINAETTLPNPEDMEKPAQEVPAAPEIIVKPDFEEQEKIQEEPHVYPEDESKEAKKSVAGLSLYDNETQPKENNEPQINVSTDEKVKSQPMCDFEPKISVPKQEKVMCRTLSDFQSPNALYNPDNNLSQADSFASASEFMDAKESQDYSFKINVQSKDLKSEYGSQYEHEYEAKRETEAEADPDSSFEVKPLVFNKKTLSSVSEGTTRNGACIYTSQNIMSPVGNTHRKALSLSDDILKDIEDFQSAIPSHVQEENDEISPVSPLALQKLGIGKEEPLARSALYDELSDDESYNQDYEEPQRKQVIKNTGSPEVQVSLFQDSSSAEIPTKSYNPFVDKDDDLGKLVVQDPGSLETKRPLLENSSSDEIETKVYNAFEDKDGDSRKLAVKNPGSTEESLFQDSSSDELETKPYNAFADKEDDFRSIPLQDDEYDYAHVGELNLGSRNSSVQPEIDYHQSSLDQRGTAETKRITLTDDEDDEEGEGYEQEFNKFADEEGKDKSEGYGRELNKLTDEEEHGTNMYDGQLTIPRSHSLHNIPNDVTSHNERSSYNSNIPSQFQSLTSDEENGKHNFIGGDSDQESSYNYYAQAVQARKFHVVNTGDYSDEDQASTRDQYSYNPSFDQDQPESLNHQDYSVIHQQTTNSSGIERDSEEESALSFTAKSPIQSDFNFETKGTPQQQPTNLSDLDLSQPPSATGLGRIANSSSPINSYDRREDTVAPVQYVSTYNGTTRRPSPFLSDAPKTTRVARSLSTTAPPLVNYNTLQEVANIRNSPHSDSHEPERSSYVEMLKMSSGTANSDVSPSVWGLPIGIADIDHSKLTAISSRTAYKRAQRTNRSDLKHGKIKQRLLASEVDDDDVGDMGSTVDGQSIDLDKSRTPSIHSPTQSVTNFSPVRGSMASIDAGVSRSGTLMGDKIGAQLGRSGSVMSTVKPVNSMTLFIANPDIEEDD